MRPAIAIAFAAVSTVSCGSHPPPSAATPPTASTASSDSAAAPSAAPVAFAAMSRREKSEHMKKVVVPQLGAVFAAADPERYAEFGCVNCHGPGARRGEFEMPSAALPKLPPKGDFAALKAEKPQVFVFMAEKVLPEMAQALGEHPFDPATGEGFSCYDCHTTE